MEPKFKVGDRLEAIEFDKEQYGLEYVTISSINEETGVCHWVADWNGGVMHSGYFFHEAKLYKNMSKRTKINFNTINGDNWEKLDVGDFGARIKEQERLEFEKKKKKEKEEKERINNIPCPACKSTNKHHHKKYENNGIIGPGYSSWLIEEYLVCLQCGIHFSDIKNGK